jgi:DNA-binding transcriptional regulator YdaS (Cro superfamily)
MEGAGDGPRVSRAAPSLKVALVEMKKVLSRSSKGLTKNSPGRAPQKASQVTVPRALRQGMSWPRMARLLVSMEASMPLTAPPDHRVGHHMVQ